MTLCLGMIDKLTPDNKALSAQKLNVGILGGGLAVTLTVILILICLLVRKKNSNDGTSSTSNITGLDVESNTNNHMPIFNN